MSEHVGSRKRGGKSRQKPDYLESYGPMKELGVIINAMETSRKYGEKRSDKLFQKRLKAAL